MMSSWAVELSLSGIEIKYCDNPTHQSQSQSSTFLFIACKDCQLHLSLDYSLLTRVRDKF